MNDCKYGMDKPNDNTLRLTLIHTPLGKFMNESGQDWQDMGLNIFTYSIAGHKGFRDGTTKEAAELNQPMMCAPVWRGAKSRQSSSLARTSSVRRTDSKK